MIGIFSSLGFLPIPFGPKPLAGKPAGRTDGYDNEVESSEEEISDDEASHAPNWGGAVAEKKKDAKVEEDLREECKMVLVVRTDLGMTKGLFFPSPLSI